MGRQLGSLNSPGGAKKAATRASASQGDTGFWRGGNLSIPTPGACTGGSSFYNAKQQRWEHRNQLKSHYENLARVKSSIPKPMPLKRLAPRGKVTGHNSRGGGWHNGRRIQLPAVARGAPDCAARRAKRKISNQEHSADSDSGGFGVNCRNESLLDRFESTSPVKRTGKKALPVAKRSLPPVDIFAQRKKKGSSDILGKLDRMEEEKRAAALRKERRNRLAMRGRAREEENARAQAARKNKERDEERKRERKAAALRQKRERQRLANAKRAKEEAALEVAKAAAAAKSKAATIQTKRNGIQNPTGAKSNQKPNGRSPKQGKAQLMQQQDHFPARPTKLRSQRLAASASEDLLGSDFDRVSQGSSPPQTADSNRPSLISPDKELIPTSMSLQLPFPQGDDYDDESSEEEGSPTHKSPVLPSSPLNSSGAGENEEGDNLLSDAESSNTFGSAEESAVCNGAAPKSLDLPHQSVVVVSSFPSPSSGDVAISPASDEGFNSTSDMQGASEPFPTTLTKGDPALISLFDNAPLTKGGAGDISPDKTNSSDDHTESSDDHDQISVASEKCEQKEETDSSTAGAQKNIELDNKTEEEDDESSGEHEPEVEKNRTLHNAEQEKGMDFPTTSAQTNIQFDTRAEEEDDESRCDHEPENEQNCNNYISQQPDDCVMPRAGPREYEAASPTSELLESACRINDECQEDEDSSVNSEVHDGKQTTTPVCCPDEGQATHGEAHHIAENIADGSLEEIDSRVWCENTEDQSDGNAGGDNERGATNFVDTASDAGSVDSLGSIVDASALIERSLLQLEARQNDS